MNKLRDKYTFFVNNIDNKVQNIINNNMIMKEKVRIVGEKQENENLVLKRDNQKSRENI